MFAGHLAGRQAFPFNVALPNGPVTYNGKLFKLCWYVRSSVAQPWGFDAKAETVFDVGPPRDTLPYLSGIPEEALPQAETLGLGTTRESVRPSVRRLLFLSLVLFFGASVTYGGLASPPGQERTLLLIFGALLLTPLYELFFWARRMISWRIHEQSLPQVESKFSTNRLLQGGRMEVSVRITPTRSMQVKAVSVVLEGFERRVGDEVPWVTHTFFKKKLALTSGRLGLQSGVPVVLDGTLVIPSDAPPSFYSSIALVSWSATVVIELPMWSDWRENTVLLVQPARPSESTTKPSPN